MNKWWERKVWDGCLAQPQRAGTDILKSRDDLSMPFGWYGYAIPTINQHGPSCVGQAWANWLECMLRRYRSLNTFFSGEQINGYDIWHRARVMFYRGDLDGGIFLSQGFDAMMDLGILPPGSSLLMIAPDAARITSALQDTPLVQGHKVHDGWFEPNPKNGCINHGKAPTLKDGGHATLLIGHTIQNGQLFYVAQNSWGPEYGYRGYFLMSEDEWIEGYFGDGPYTVALPEKWTEWEGWRRFVTKEAR